MFAQDRSVKLIDIPEPYIQTELQIKLRILEAGICGTDRFPIERFPEAFQAHPNSIKIAITITESRHE